MFSQKITPGSSVLLEDYSGFLWSGSLRKATSHIYKYVYLFIHVCTMIGVVWHLFFLFLWWWPNFFIFVSSLAFFVFSWTTHALTLRCHCLGWCGILFVMFLFCSIVLSVFSCFLFLQNRITSQERDIVSGRDTMTCQDMRTCHERTDLFERGDLPFLSGRSVGVIPSHILVSGCRVLTRPTPSPAPPHFF